ncbi:Putative Trafficking protein particle complex subunit 2/Sedlin [Aspergillus calidoustus]|uniref:Putative Trafficking protein particle complex subunit 2/Sedlin n=1 Tax=Aspergillus calidoustus TaxID=454130 RepID=A0A0U5C187_ASPCI|nr:Putative Trafficking protein particle complex subunit 2/Sedlin [Aspergillus calidoustus]
MSYYFTILSPTDVPLFNIAFGTSKSGGDGIARFRFPDAAQNTYMTQFIINSSLDMLEEAQWMSGNMYLKHIDTYPPASAYISAFLTPSGTRFVLLHQPPQPNIPASSSTTGAAGSMSMSLSASTTSSSGGGLFGGSGIGSSGRTSSSSIAANPTAPQTEEAVRQFMSEVYEGYVKTVMSPFYRRGMEIRSPVFRARVSAAGRKWL